MCRDCAVSGTVITGEPRIVRIDGYWVDLPSRGGFVVLTRHTDRPGIIGRDRVLQVQSTD